MDGERNKSGASFNVAATARGAKLNASPAAPRRFATAETTKATAARRPIAAARAARLTRALREGCNARAGGRLSQPQPRASS